MDRRSQIHHRIFVTGDTHRTNRTERWNLFFFYYLLLSLSFSFESHAAFSSLFDEKIPPTPETSSITELSPSSVQPTDWSRNGAD
jgi:hypothetical protein